MAVVVRRAFPRGYLPNDFAGVAINGNDFERVFLIGADAVRMEKILPSSPVCLTAFAPGTTAPSTAVVRNIRLPHTIGDECERPSIAVFHLMFLVGVHSDGRFFSFEIPEPSGPRRCGQFPAAAFSVIKPSPVTAKPIPTISVKTIRFTVVISFLVNFLFCSKTALLQTRRCSTLSARSRDHPKSPASPSSPRQPGSSRATHTSARLSQQTRRHLHSKDKSSHQMRRATP